MGRLSFIGGLITYFIEGIDLPAITGVRVFHLPNSVKALSPHSILVAVIEVRNPIMNKLCDVKVS
jgi:hypothetical protein